MVFPLPPNGPTFFLFAFLLDTLFLYKTKDDTAHRQKRLHCTLDDSMKTQSAPLFSWFLFPFYSHLSSPLSSPTCRPSPPKPAQITQNPLNPRLPPYFKRVEKVRSSLGPSLIMNPPSPLPPPVVFCFSYVMKHFPLLYCRLKDFAPFHSPIFFSPISNARWRLDLSHLLIDGCRFPPEANVCPPTTVFYTTPSGRRPPPTTIDLI